MDKEREENNNQNISDSDDTNNGDDFDDDKNPFNVDYDERGVGHERKNDKKL